MTFDVYKNHTKIHLLEISLLQDLMIKTLR